MCKPAHAGLGLVVAAPSSGSGKTVLTLGLLRALSRRGPVRAAKSGPDYIDPMFHAAACRAPCRTLDAWAMAPDRLRTLASQGSGPLIVEGAMGLYDGVPPEGTGSTADLAQCLGLPVVLVVDAARMAQSVAPLVHGFSDFRPAPLIAGVVLNRVGSARHETMLRRALAQPGLPPVLGALPRTSDLDQPARHLGLVQATERPDLEEWLEAAADVVSAQVDIDALPWAPIASAHQVITWAKPPAQRIAVAQDLAFGFSYPHQIEDWRAAGAEIRMFSPLADEAVPEADFVFLPGGYPELHAGRIAHASTFMRSLRAAAQTAELYGECGGYMVLGNGLIDKDGQRHAMAGLLPLETTFADRALHLGYRMLQAEAGPMTGTWSGHEFHYAKTLRADGDPLFIAKDAEGTNLPSMGLRLGRVQGSFAHVIDPAQKTGMTPAATCTKEAQ